MDFRQVLMLSFLKLGHISGVCVVSIIALHKCFGIVHNVLVWGFFESKDLDGSEVGVFRFLDKLELVFEVFPFLN